MLTPDERARAARYRRSRDGARFIARRATLRMGLGQVLGVDGARLRFQYAAAGKPYLVWPSKGAGVGFNVAHSDGLAVFACTLRGELGVDVERVRDHDDLDRVAKLFFSPGESEALAACRPGERTHAFYRCWTRKEAYVKAIGRGLGAALRDFEVAFARDARPALLRVGWDPSETRCWRIAPLELPDGYVGALAVKQ